jgi:two-component system, chemotaxis family, sensor kinase CheA
MNNPLDVQEFLAGFLAEADEHLRSAAQNMLALDQSLARGDSNPRAVRSLFRSLHTIKGLSAMVGAEPIVDVAHAMETVLRAADRAPGTLGRGALEPLLQGLRRIEAGVAALAGGKPLAPAPRALLESLTALQPTAAGAAAAGTARLAIPPELLAKLDSGDRQQLLEGIRAGRRAIRADFVPSPARAAEGINITSVRERVAKVADIVKVVPISLAPTPQAPGGIAFSLLVLSSASDEQIAEAASTTPEALVRLAENEAAPERPPTSDADEEEDLPGVSQRHTVRVEVARLDDALERLSALVVNRFRLVRTVGEMRARGVEVRELGEIVAETGRQLRDLRAAIMRARMVPVSELLERVPLIVRGIGRSSTKRARVEIDAGDAELDKAVADRIFPALVHLVRNAVDHGIEAPEDRRRLGKPEEGVVRVACFERSNRQLELSISDDGRGVDAEKLARKAGRPLPQGEAALLDLLTLPGLSARDETTTTSGRGMGMDIVKRVAVDQLGGELSLRTQAGAGSTFTLRIPLSISIVDAFSFACGPQQFVVPVAMVEEIIEIDPSRLLRAPSSSGQREVHLFERRGEAVPVVALEGVLQLERRDQPRRKALIVRRNAEPVAFEVDRMLGQQEVVVRPLEDALVRVAGVTGSTDLGDGRPTLVLDLVSFAASLGQGAAA